MSRHVKAQTDAAGRRFEIDVDIDAPAERVWAALTDPVHLVRWFPLQAEVVPGVGGVMRWGWDGAWQGESAIEAWEPDRHLRLVELRQGYDADGRPLTDPEQSRTLAVEITLESHQGTTRMRLVHSGFGHGADWDDELDGISTGWQFELRGLREYVERHFGHDRHYAWARAISDASSEDLWPRLLVDSAFAFGGTLPREGQPFTVRIGEQRLSGITLLNIENADFAGIVDDLHGAIFRIGTFRARGRTGMMAWLASHDAGDADRIRTFGRDAQAVLDRTAGLKPCATRSASA